jgi:hypothetical protein
MEAQDNIPGLAAQSFGSDRFTYSDGGVYRAALNGFFDRINRKINR